MGGEATSMLGSRIPLTALMHAVAVAEYLNFRHAANVLGTTQSSVSARIKALEEDLGILLFERRHRGVRLTDAGRSFIVYALLDGENTLVVTGLFLFVNMGLGLRGPPGFHAAIVAAKDDTRGGALLVVSILLTAALGTALVGFFITYGLVAIATGAALLSVGAVVILRATAV